MQLRIDDIKAETLPACLQELAEVIGLTSALKLAEAFPGVPVYIPKKPHPEHKLALIVGYENLKKLSALYEREFLHLPNITVRKLKHQIALEMRSQGFSARAVALKTGYTQRRVEQLFSQGTTEEQPDLFSQQSSNKN